jgi:hypothetical protein
LSIVKIVRALAPAVGVLAIAVTTTLLVTKGPDTRSVGPAHGAAEKPPTTFVRGESAGLFVGVQEFTHDATLTVPYAVDDAIDLAYKFTLDSRASLAPPGRVVLALSGKPFKEESQESLRELRKAGVRIEHATSGDVLHLLEEQTARVGPNGVLVLSLATHGFQDDDGDAYILGSTSAIGSAETSLRTSTLLDIAGRAPRSLIFVDACRDRIGVASRGAGPDPATAAPLIRKMGRVQGQVIFYAAAAGRYAYDDPVHGNGVFTRAVLDGLSCKASAPRGEVIAQTLHTYVDREVRRWMRENRKPLAKTATQVSMEGETRNMPLAQCWRRDGRCSRVAIADSTITVYDDRTHPLWRHDFGERVMQAEVVDLDADALCEVVVGLRDRIMVFDRDGRALWRRNLEGMSLRTFATGDLFRKRTNQIVALWNDAGITGSRLSVFDSAGEELSSYEHAGVLQHVAIGRPTHRHAPKIAVAAGDSLFLIDPKKIAAGVPVWRHALLSAGDAIVDVGIRDANNDSRQDIVVSTKSGTTLFQFDGNILGLRRGRTSDAKPRWTDLPRRTRRRVTAIRH